MGNIGNTTNAVKPAPGAVERVRTGEKYRFGDIEAIGRLIAQMVSEKNGREIMKSVR